MLEQSTFLKGIKYLNAYYTNFNFNINDDMKLKIWYDVFVAFDNLTFTDLVKSYCTSNIYAPQSPSHLLEYAKQVRIAQSMSADEAWEYTISLLRQLSYDFRRFYDKVDNTLISNVIKQMRHDFVGLMTDQLPFVKRTFIGIYNRELENSISQEVREGLGWTTQTLLPKGEL